MITKKLLLTKLRQLTTDVGIYQHGKLSEPDPSFGYALEDQARALIVVHEFGDKNLEKIYLEFIRRAQQKDGSLMQYYDDNKGFIDEDLQTTIISKEEASGLTLWSLIATKNLLHPLVDNLQKTANFWISPRAMAAALLGLALLKKQTEVEKNLIDRLTNLFQRTASTDWEWFENYLTYANAILCWALWEIILRRKDKSLLTIAEKSTCFLISVCQENNIPTPIGNQGWYTRGGKKPLYDQQPIEAAYFVCCLEKAFLASRNTFYLDWAQKWWSWFWGNNTKKVSLITNHYACYDGLTANGVNLNQGAESNICFLLAYLAIKRLKKFIKRSCRQTNSFISSPIV